MTSMSLLASAAFGVFQSVNSMIFTSSPCSLASRAAILSASICGLVAVPIFSVDESAAEAGETCNASVRPKAPMSEIAGVWKKRRTVDRKMRMVNSWDWGVVLIRGEPIHRHARASSKRTSFGSVSTHAGHMGNGNPQRAAQAARGSDRTRRSVSADSGRSDRSSPLSR
ncbi:protein of unknown function [Paraburkholderia dioscoreae]|uniref:Uncharacterized protein n=1 Tax=Paraburkholderia dioscoreae TaxID=2604047 RepID=A0A5Q4ZRG5_9BURK|nr:protein of unknown function [Paraburkholderia dioscoreae]